MESQKSRSNVDEVIKTVFYESFKFVFAEDLLVRAGNGLQIWEHQVRVAYLAGKIAEVVDGVDLQKVKFAGIFHDLGKLTWPGELFTKPGKFLTEDDWKIIFAHPVKSIEIMEELYGDDSFLFTGNPSVADIVLYHHEKPDGNGYYRIKDIPLETICVAIADIFDACSHGRNYRVKLPFVVAAELAVKDFRMLLKGRDKEIKEILIAERNHFLGK